MPVYWFALGQTGDKDLLRAALVFFILHGLLYPASNGYNGYMDRDEGPVGGLARPAAPTRELFYVSTVLDLAGIGLAFAVNRWFAVGCLVYVLASRAYSWRGIRLKKYPFTGYLTVILCQGALVYGMVFAGCRRELPGYVPWMPMIASSLLVGGAYPLTQVYQHAADRRDGVRTLSMRLGVRGTFVYCALVYLAAFVLLGLYFGLSLAEKEFAVLAACLAPVPVYFFVWARAVWKNPAAADFRHAMTMNWLAASCTNLGFILVAIFD